MSNAPIGTPWVLDPMHSEVQLQINPFGISTVGIAFKTFAGSAQSQGDDFNHAEMEFSLAVASLDTNNERRDGFLRADYFFDAAHYPQLTFRSTSCTKTGDSDYTLTGDLTIKDVTKPVTLAAKYGGTAVDFRGATKAGFAITGTLNRQDYNLNLGGEAAIMVLGEEVKLLFNVQFTKQVPA